MSTLNLIAWCGMGFALLLFVGFTIAVTRKNKRLEEELRRRSVDNLLDNEAPDAFVEYESDDGAPGSRRGKVWTDYDRDQHRQKTRNLSLRLM
ncbi:MAG: hypothetical protein ACR2PR_08175 [Pseudohongiellaceae bacterium]